MFIFQLDSGILGSDEMKILHPHVDLERFFCALTRSKCALLMLDYDGTLAPFAQNSHGCPPYPGVREKMLAIMRRKHTHVVVLSGRSLEKLKTLLNMDPFPELWGSHGGERLKPGKREPIVKQVDPQIAPLLEKGYQLAHRLAPALFCERKPFSLALHWRGQDPHIAKEQSQHVREHWQPLTGTLLEIDPFDQGIELRPKGINKGQAVNTLLNEAQEAVPIAYLGDDLTDEDAFSALGRKALKILVRQQLRPTQADVQLLPPEELLLFFDRWIDSQKEGPL